MGEGTGGRKGELGADERDLGTEIEDEMRASGRGHVMGVLQTPRQRPNGAYHDAQEPVEAAMATAGAWTERAAVWLDQNRRLLAVVAGAAVIAAVGLITARRLSD